MLSGARRLAVMLLLTLLTTATAWAQPQVSIGFSMDPDIPEGEVGHYYLNMPTTGNVTVNIPVGVQSFIVYDDGGKDGNYSNNCDGSITLIAPEGCKLQLSGTVMTYKGEWLDQLYSSYFTLGYNFTDPFNSSDSSPIGNYTSSGRDMTIGFRSTESNTYKGFEAKVMVVDEARPRSINIANAEHGSITSSKSSAMVGEPVTLTVTPDNGYMPSECSVQDAAGNPLTYMGWYSNTSTFDMPGTDVTVTPAFTNKWTAEGGLYINMPDLIPDEDETIYATIPAGVQSFKIYDPGGKEGKDYSNRCWSTLVLTAPEGCKLQLTGSIKTYTSVAESVNDYINVSGWGNIRSSYSGIPNTIYPVISSGREMTLLLHSSGRVFDDVRLDLTVTVIYPTYTISAPTGESVNMLVRETKTVEIPVGVQSFKVYDAGGEAGNDYGGGGSCDGDLVLTAPEGCRLQVSGYVTAYRFAVDGLRIYDGTDVFSQLLTDKLDVLFNYGVPTAIPTTTSSGRSLMLSFYSKGEESDARLDLTVMVIDENRPHNININTTEGGKVSVKGLNTYTYGNTVTLRVTPDNGYMLDDLGAVDAAGNPVTDLRWYLGGNTVTFDMPGTDVTITPTFTTAKTARDGLCINMLDDRYTDIYATIPVGVKSFKVYDPGGKEGDDYGRCSTSLVMTAPEGCKLQVSGTFMGYYKEHAYDFLVVNDDSGDRKLIYAFSDGVTQDIGTIVSCGQHMTLRYNSHEHNYNDARLDLTVAVLDESSPHSITIANTAGGTVTSDKTSATPNETVTLTAAYAAGYLLNELDVRDVGNVPISVTDMLWYTDNNTATFEMPAADVTVTPTFLDTWTAEGGLCINMPSGITNATIPVGVQSFKVYDNGGKDGSYSRGGRLNLTAPEGCQIQLSGSITLGAGHDFSVLDGTDILINGATSTSDGIETDLPTVTSNGRGMTLFFNVHGPSYDYAGLDLTVKIIYTNSPYALTAPTGESVDMPTNGTKTIMISEGVESFKVYDDGGADGKYAKDCDGYLTLTAPEGCRLQLSGRLRTYDSNDYLTVYDGTGLTTTILGPVGGSNGHNYIDIGTVTSSGQGMTLYFRSDDISTVDVGLDLTVTVINASDPIEPTDPTEPTVPSGSYTVSFNGNGGRGSMANQTFTMNEAQYLTANTFTRTGYMFTGWNTAADGSGSSYIDCLNVINLTTTPGATVTLYAQWAYDVTINNTGNSVNMPKTGSGLVPVSEGVESFKVYDDGGASNDYSDRCDGYLTLIAPKGCVLQLSGSITSVDSNDYLTVYDGSDNTTTILGPVSGSEGIGNVTSSGRSMTLYFHSDRGTHYAGLDLTVTVIYNLTDDTDFDVDALAGLISEWQGNPANVSFTRSFTDGVATTICLPFPMTGIEGGNVYEFVGVEYDENDGWVATMTYATPDGNNPTEAHKPYLFMPTKTDNVTFSGFISNVASSYTAGTTTSADDDWTFRGTYTRLHYGTDPMSGNVYGFAANTNTGAGDQYKAGEFVRAVEGASVRPFRAFLTYTGSEESLNANARSKVRGAANGLPESITVRLLGKDGEINGIGTITLSTGEFSTEGWYSLDGRKLDGEPTKKGLYIHNGRKIVK